MQSALGGIAVLVLAVMAKYVMNRLWQKTLTVSAADALASLPLHGFSMQPLGYGPVVRATGKIDGKPAYIEWRGGIRGETSVLRVGGRKRRLPLVRTGSDLERLLFGEE